MKRKAQNVIEVISLVAVVGVLVIVVFMYTQNNVDTTSKLSKLNSGKVDNTVASTSDEKITTDRIEIGGTLSETIVNSNSSTVTENWKEADASYLLKLVVNGEDIYDMANNLIDENQLNMEKIDKTQLNESSKNTLIIVAAKTENVQGENKSNNYLIYNQVLGIYIGGQEALEAEINAAKAILNTPPSPSPAPPVNNMSKKEAQETVAALAENSKKETTSAKKPQKPNLLTQHLSFLKTLFQGIANIFK